MDEIREVMRKKNQQIEDIENAGGSQEEVDKLKREVSSLEIEHQKARSKYDGSVQAAKDRSMLEEEVQVLEDSLSVDVAKNEKEQAREAIKQIKKRKEAIGQRRKFEFKKLLDNEETDLTSERKQEAEKKISDIDQERKRLDKEQKMFEEILGVKTETEEREMKLLQIDKEELEKAKEKAVEIINDKDAAPYEKDAAEERMELRDKEIRRIDDRFEEIGRDTTQLEDGEKSLLERVKDIFKKYGVTLTAIFLAAGATIGAVISALTRGLKATGKALGNGLKALGKKIASILPGLLGAIVSFLFKAAGQAIGFLAEHTWLLILAVVTFLFEKYLKKRR